MACGVPVVCSNTSSLPEVGGDAALYFEPTNTDSILSALRQLPAKRDELVEKGLKRAAGYTWRACAEATYEQIRLAAKA